MDAVTSPARVESENFSRAVDYSPGNLGDCANNHAVDFVTNTANSLGTCNIGFTEPGEWVEYDVITLADGTYDLSFGLSADGTRRKVRIYIDGTSYGELEFSALGPQRYTWPRVQQVDLKAGTHKIRVFFLEQDIYFDAFTIKQVESTTPRVTGLSLFDTKNQIKVEQYSPLSLEEVNDIDLDALKNRELTLWVDTEGPVKSVRFGTPVRPNYRTDNLEEFVLSETQFLDPDRWLLFRGEHEFIITAYSEENAQGNASEPVTVKFNLLETHWRVKDDSLDLIANIGESAEQELIIDNIGNLSGDYELKQLPAWLTATQTKAEIETKTRMIIGLSTPACINELVREATIEVWDPGEFITPILIRQVCTRGTKFDLAFDRFYINQAVPGIDTLHAPDRRIDLVRGRPGIIRTFVTKANELANVEPRVEFHYKTQTGSTGVILLEGATEAPLEADESTLAGTYNALIPPEIIEPGTEFFVVIDPENEIAEANKTNNRYPEQGYLEMRVADIEPPEFVIVPVVINETDPGITPALVEELFEVVMQWHPLRTYNYTIRSQPFTYSGDSWTDALKQLDDLRNMANTESYYLGLVSERINDGLTTGIAYRPNRLSRFPFEALTALSRKKGTTIAHEIGHSFSLRHTDCGGPANPENRFPLPNARTGTWGWDIIAQELVRPVLSDFMSYCEPAWTSAFSYSTTMAELLSRQEVSARNKQQGQMQKIQFNAPKNKKIRVIRGVKSGGKFKLYPAYTVTGSEPTYYSGEYVMNIYGDSGQLMTSAAFDIINVAHAEEYHFTVKIPAEQLTAAIGRYEITQNGETIFNKTISKTDPGLQKTSPSPKLSLAANNGVRVTWLANGEDTLQIRDAQTQAILALDTTGNVVVYPIDKELELTLLSEGNGYTILKSAPTK